MHPYATDSEDRKLVPFFLAVFAIGGAFGVAALLGAIGIELPWWAPPLDTMTLYGIFYWLFDRFVWRWSPLHNLGIIKTPNLAGKWKGHVTPIEATGISSGLATEADVDFVIRQSWQSISVRGTANLSQSHSTSGSILMRSEDGTLSYDYINEPIACAPATMQIHRGSAKLSLTKGGTELSGEYYSGRGRQNIGTLVLKRAKVA
jgi:hypothetical protein